MTNSRREFLATLPCGITIDVGRGLEVSVTVPNIRKADLISILATFFAEGPDGKNSSELKKHTVDELTKTFTRASSVRVILTSSCPVEGVRPAHD